MFEQRKINGWSYFCIPELVVAGVEHGFFTKASPSIEPPGNDGEAFLDAFSLRRFEAMRQEHGDRIHVVRKGEHADAGDGIILLERGVAGIIKTADCLPVIIVDAAFPMAGIVHAGWRGTVQKITQKAVHTMLHLGAERSRLKALLGPSISSCCYEVQEDVHSAFNEAGFPGEVFRKAGSRTFLDIREANRTLLIGAGVETIYDTARCTYCSSGLFASYRKGDKSSRQINFVSLK
jgi:YfiH family protein